VALGEEELLDHVQHEWLGQVGREELGEHGLHGQHNSDGRGDGSGDAGWGNRISRPWVTASHSADAQAGGSAGPCRVTLESRVEMPTHDAEHNHGEDGEGRRVRGSNARYERRQLDVLVLKVVVAGPAGRTASAPRLAERREARSNGAHAPRVVNWGGEGVCSGVGACAGSRSGRHWGHAT
jgi:hypothetical protein